MTSTSLIVKRSIKSAASLARAGTGFPRSSAGSVNIFAYHRVVADVAKAERDAIYGIVISTSTFRRHCELLQRSFDVVSLETAMHFLEEKRQTPRPLAVITFDDGYLDFYQEAFPVLNDLGLPATVFVPTGYIGQSKPLAHDRIYWLLKQAQEKAVPICDALQRAGITDGFKRNTANLLKLTDLIVYLPNDLREKAIIELECELGDKFEDYPPEYQLLSWEMVREMAEKGIDFAAHTVNHVILPLEDDSVINNEIAASKADLETHLGKKVISFAYPNGEYNGAIRNQVALSGYKIAVTTEKKNNSAGADQLALGRVSLCEESTRGISGVYSPRVANFRLGA